MFVKPSTTVALIQLKDLVVAAAGLRHPQACPKQIEEAHASTIGVMSDLHITCDVINFHGL